MKKRILIQGSMAICAAVGVVVFHKWLFSREQGFMEEFKDVVGMLLILNGFFLRIMARGYKAMCSRQSRALVTGGIYRLTRNPMYFATLMIGSGAVMVLLHWWLFPVFLVAFLAIYLPEMRKEEAWLINHFGDVYLVYCRQTPKFFPQFREIFNDRFWNELRCDWKWFWPELRAMVITVAAIMAIECWQEFELFGQYMLIKEISEFLILSVLMVAVWAFFIVSMKKEKVA